VSEVLASITELELSIEFMTIEPRVRWGEMKVVVVGKVVAFV
jgi:hypothetical protein